MNEEIRAEVERLLKEWITDLPKKGEGPPDRHEVQTKFWKFIIILNHRLVELCRDSPQDYMDNMDYCIRMLEDALFDPRIPEE
ncbi:MAG: hypothetical protein RH862_20300 [Leptospiraceae bacterium]